MRIGLGTTKRGSEPRQRRRASFHCPLMAEERFVYFVTESTNNMNGTPKFETMASEPYVSHTALHSEAVVTQKVVPLSSNWSACLLSRVSPWLALARPGAELLIVRFSRVDAVAGFTAKAFVSLPAFCELSAKQADSKVRSRPRARSEDRRRVVHEPSTL